MIGCEKLCGGRDGCGACQKLVMALGAHDAGKQVSRWNRTEYDAALDPSALAELLARALRGRGVDATVECNRGAQYRIVYYVGGVRVWLATNRGNPEVIPSARTKLSRLLAAGLCGSEEALRLLEGP